jgi:PGF-pre-PGF domain-containing protein
MESETDFYPLMEQFEAYSTAPPETDNGSSSEGSLAASGNLNTGETTSMHFAGSAVTGITVTAAQHIDGIMVTIAPSGSGPAGLDAPVYQYLVANLTYTTDDAIAEAVFTFDVPASWLEEQGLSPQEVSLWRYHDGTWVSLPTEAIGTEGGRIFYRAVSPGFSYFAVAGGAAALPGATETAPVTGSTNEATPVEMVPVTPINASTPDAAATPGPSDETAPATTPQQSPLVFAPAIALGALLVLRRR